MFLPWPRFRPSASPFLVFASRDGIIWAWNFEGHPHRVSLGWRTVWEVQVSFVEELALSLTG